MPEDLFNGRRSRTPALRPQVVMARSLSILTVLGIISALYFAKAILMPLAIATLMTFVLAPPMRMLRSWGVGRIPAVATVVLGAFLIIFAIGTFLGEQVTELAKQLPQYQYVIQSKIERLSTATSGGAFERLSGLLDRLNRQLATRQSSGPQQEPQAGTSTAPTPVEIVQPPPSSLDLIQRVLSPLLDPLGTFGIVVIFVIFFLLERRDLRDRFIRIAGSHDLKRTTEALDDAATRLSRYFLAQTALNTLFGVIVAVGLALIGVPNPILWGVLAMVLRFVPYIGAVIAAAFPTALAIAVTPDWTMALWTIGLFVVVEPVIGQMLEPLMYGHSTGLSPVAVVVAATFWTWLWGPIGLLLSTPITVCLAVLGRHIEWLEFVDVLIGQDTALSPPQRFYQRALAQDLDEVTDQAEELLKQTPLLAYYDEVVLPGLILAQIDFTRGLLDRRHIEGLNEVLQELVDELSSHQDAKHLDKAQSAKSDEAHEETSSAAESSPSEGLPPHSVTCLWGRGPFDKALASILAQLLGRLGLNVELDITSDSSKVVRLGDPEVKIICLSSLTIGRSAAQTRYSIRKMRSRFSHAKVVLCSWGEDRREPDAQDQALAGEADCRAASFAAAIECLQSDHLLTAPHDSGSGAVGPSAA